jgi:hypothetical protein
MVKKAVKADRGGKAAVNRAGGSKWQDIEVPFCGVLRNISINQASPVMGTGLASGEGGRQFDHCYLKQDFISLGTKILFPEISAEVLSKTSLNNSLF